MNKEDFLKWFNDLPKKEKIIVIIWGCDDSIPMNELRQMSESELLNPNILNHKSYEDAIKNVLNYNEEIIEHILNEYKI